MHEHHIVKRASGGGDERDNIAILDAHCHHALHQIESALKNKKKIMLIPDLLRSLYPDSNDAQSRCLHKATTAALGRAIDTSPDIDFSAWDTDDLVHITPPKVSPLVKKYVSVVAKELKGAHGKSVGVSGYVKLLIEADLRRRGFKV